MATVVFVVGSAEERGCNASVLGKKEPVSHPVNCKEECPYGYDRPSASLVTRRLCRSIEQGDEDSYEL